MTEDEYLGNMVQFIDWLTQKVSKEQEIEYTHAICELNAILMSGSSTIKSLSSVKNSHDILCVADQLNRSKRFKKTKYQAAITAVLQEYSAFLSNR